MLETVIRGGVVVDGTGAPGRLADVGIQGGRIVAVGEVGDDGARTIDADGLVVAPGFVDLHTHYDAQAFWDTTLSPSPLHGVTTVVGGNCGFTIAPLTPEDGDYLMRMLTRVEGMPLESLQAGVPWDWRTTGEYLDRLDGTLMPNAGFLVGHSALRRVVMHDDIERHATADEIAAMQQLLRDGLAAGGLGFSSSWAPSHNDHFGRPVPTRFAAAEELIALCGVLREFPGTTIEFVPGVGQFSDEAIDVMARMSVAADRPLNWNVLAVNNANGHNASSLAASDHAESLGGAVFALSMPDTMRFRVTFKSGFLLDLLPGWEEPMALPDDEKLAMLRDPAGRSRLNELADAAPDGIRSFAASWGGYTLVETFSPETKSFEGRTVADVAAELGKSEWDTLADIVIADDLRTSLTKPDGGQDDDTWKKRVEVWRDRRVIVGASDAGAHLDMVDSFAYTTFLLGRAVRERGLLPIEEAVHLLTDRPARLYGIKERGRVVEGWHADLVVFDPDRIGAGPLHTRYDLPAGAGRLYGGAEGIEHVFVNGVEVVRGTELTDARPGTLLRSGRDTETVTAAQALATR